MSLNYPQHKCNFPGKSENSKSTQICLKFSISTSLLSALMTYVKNISNWPVPGGQIMDMSQNYSIRPYILVMLLEKRKVPKAHDYVLKIV